MEPNLGMKENKFQLSEKTTKKTQLLNIAIGCRTVNENLYIKPPIMYGAEQQRAAKVIFDPDIREHIIGDYISSWACSVCVENFPPPHIITNRMASTLLKFGVLSLALLQVVASPAQSLERRQEPDNIVKIDSVNSYCMIVPRDAHTNIGDSERPGGMQTYCSQAAHTSDRQGFLPSNFWSNVEIQSGLSSRGARFVQLTGCIRPETLDRLNPGDGGGQYDSSGGDGGNGNPAGSKCTGYNHYVELVEPADKRACIKCCDNFDDCPLDKDTSGCPAVIQGNYFNCG